MRSRPRSWTRACLTGACSGSTTRPTTWTPRCCCCPSWDSCPPTTSASRATVLAIADELTEDGLVLRYRVEGTDTGFSGEGGHLHHLLVLAGDRPGHDRRDRTAPSALCQKLLSFAGPLQLYAGGDRRHDRAASRELPAGIHPPRPDRSRITTHRVRAGEQLALGELRLAAICRRLWCLIKRQTSIPQADIGLDATQSFRKSGKT